MAILEWPIDKLGLIQSALAVTGDIQPQTADDGSDEWTVASPAYERALAYMMENHGWTFATKVATLTPAGNVPADTQFDTAYEFPQDLCHLIWVRIDNTPASYDILNNQIVLNAQGGPPPPSPPVAPRPVTAKYVSLDNADPTRGTPTFILALQTFTMSGIYRGLHEDTAEADRLWMAAREILSEARSRSDQQKPKRALYNSRITAARRVRRPWWPSPGGWGGAGGP